MGSWNVGTLTTAGCNYTCKISWSDPTRSGDSITIKNVKATITVQSGSSHTLNRIAVSCSINGSSRASNVTVLPAQDSSWPDSKEVTIVGSGGYTFSCLNTSFSISATFRSTGYGTDWNNNYGSASNSGSISCPARTYSVTFNANGGSGAPAAQSKTYNTNLTLSSTIPTYSGFAFKGWSGSDSTTYQAGSVFKGNYGLTLTAIWQALTTDLDDVEDIEIGEAPELTWTPQAAELTYKINLSLGEWSWQSDLISPGSTAQYVYDSYTVPMTVCEQIPTQTEGLMKAELLTYNGEDLTGTSEKYFTVSVPDSVVPGITDLTLTDASENALGVYLQNYSWVSAELEYAEAYGSSIVSATMEIGEDIISIEPESSPVTLVSDILPEDGTVTLTFTITDQRGRSTTDTSTITVYEYNKPTLDTELSLEGTDTLLLKIHATYDTVGGLNNGYISLDGGATRQAITEDYEKEVRATITYPESRNRTSTVIVYDDVTSVTVVKKLYPGRGNRFGVLNSSKYYLGIDEKGWKDTESAYEGGIMEDGTIWFRRSSGEGPTGIGFPMQVEPDADYELIYSANVVNEDTVAYMSFFRSEGTGETGFHYLSTTYETGKPFRSGAIFHTPADVEGDLWGILVFGASPMSYEVTSVGYQEISAVVLRKVERHNEPLKWEAVTGNLGLDTPNQKYISRLQLRIEYEGTLNVGIAYDNAGTFENVHKSSSGHMRSLTVSVNVRRSDHFRLKLNGVGQANLYSMGYYTEDGSARCLI